MSQYDLSQNMDFDEKDDQPVSSKRRRGSYVVSRKRRRSSSRKRVSFTPRSFGNQIFRYRQTVSGSQIGAILNNNISQLVAGQGFMVDFQLANLPQVATFTALYDSYRIRKVVFRMYPQKQYMVTPDTVAGGLPVSGSILTAIDHDGGASPASVNDMMQYSTCKMQNVFTFKPIIRTVFPNANGGVSDGAAIVEASNLSNKTWINCSRTGIPYNAIAVYVEGYASATTAQSWRVFADYYIEFKGVR